VPLWLADTTILSLFGYALLCVVGIAVIAVLPPAYVHARRQRRDYLRR
jgi:cyanate permease